MVYDIDETGKRYLKYLRYMYSKVKWGNFCVKYNSLVDDMHERALYIMEYILRYLEIIVGLFQLQMRISFIFLLAKGLRRFLFIMINRSFYSPVRRGYIRKVSMHLVQKYFPHDCSTDTLSCI